MRTKERLFSRKRKRKEEREMVVAIIRDFELAYRDIVNYAWSDVAGRTGFPRVFRSHAYHAYVE